MRVPVGIDLMKIGTKWQNEAGTRDHMTKFGWDQGPNGKNWLGPGTKWQKLAGTRDQMAKIGWDQGPNDKIWLGPGTIAPPHSESQK